MENNLRNTSLSAPANVKWDMITSSYVDISWKMVGGAAAYNIYRTIDGNNSYEKIGKHSKGKSSWLVTNFRDEHVTPGITYCYKVSAENENGESPKSEVLKVKVVNLPAAFKFDFGSEGSPAVERYTKITNTTAYSTALGYGFADISKVASAYRENDAYSSDINKLYKGFCAPKEMMAPYSFKVDLPNGIYGIRLIAGDLEKNINRTDLYVNGEFLGLVTSERGKVSEKTFKAVITNGQAEITFSRNGRVNVLEIVPIVPSVTSLEAEGCIDNTSYSVVLRWGKVEEASNYKIYRAMTEQEEYSEIGNTTTTVFADQGAKAGDRYSYKVSIVTPNGESPLSSAACASVVDTKVNAPSIPTDVKVIDTEKNAVALGWKAVSDSERYNIYRSDREGSNNYIYVGTSDRPSFVDGTVVTNISYYYSVSALNKGGESEKSTAVKSEVAAALPAPTGISISEVKESSLKINWSELKGAEAYNVYRADFGEKEYKCIGKTTLNSYKDSELSKGRTYIYKITALNSGIESHKSKEVLAMTKTDVTLISTLDLTAAGTGCRMRLGDLNGDGRMEILMVQADYMGKESKNGKITGRRFMDAYVPHAVNCLTAFDLDGNLLWQVGTPDTDVMNSGADEPAEIYDIDDDGNNEVLCCMSHSIFGNVDGEKTIESRTEKFLILDGKTGAVKKEYDLPETPITGHDIVDVDLCRSHDSIIIANLTGNKKPQDIILKDRYHQLWALDKDFNLLWTYEGATGHYPWPYDYDGDGKDEIMCCYDMIDHDGKVLWCAQDVSDHVDCIWVGDVDGNPENGKEILIGGSSTLLYDTKGNELWRNDSAIEPQQVMLGNFQIDKPGLEIFGMDRTARGWDTFNGTQTRDALYIVSSEGETILSEEPDDSGFTTATKLVRNWNGTYAPLGLAFKRGSINGEEIKPALHDGYLNKIAELPFSTWANIMVSSICGDNREEIIAYQTIEEDGVKKTMAYIYANEAVDLKSSITGTAMPQLKMEYDFTRYGCGEVLDITSMIPCGFSAKEKNNSSVKLTWIPVLGASSYNIYRSEGDREFIKIADSENAFFIDETIKVGTKYSYKISTVNAEGESEKTKAIAV